MCVSKCVYQSCSGDYINIRLLTLVNVCFNSDIALRTRLEMIRNRSVAVLQELKVWIAYNYN